MVQLSRALATVLVGGCCLALMAGCGGAEMRRQKALAKGAEYYSAGNYEKARVEFRNALQITPNDPDARFQNGRVLEKLQKFREAAQFYQGAIDARPDFPEARAALGHVLLFGGAPEQALETLNPGLEKHPDDVAMLPLRAAVRARLKDVPGAFEDAERAYRLAPKHEDVVAVLAGLYNGNARSDKAQALLEQGISDHPESVDLRLALAQLYASLSDNAKTEATLREIVRLQPGEFTHRIRLAQFLVTTKQIDAAEAVLREGATVLPKQRELEGALVDFLAAFRGAQSAEEELRAYAKAAPAGDVEPSFALAYFYERLNAPAKAEAIYQEIIAGQGSRPGGLVARDRLAALRVQQNDVPGARKLIAEVLASSPRDTDALALRGNIALGTGDAKGAIADLRSALRDQPNSPAILRTLARAHVQNGEPALAEETLRRAVDANAADPGSRLDLAEFLTAHGKPEQAKPILVELARLRPADVGVQQSLFRASAASKDYATARAAANAILAAQPNGALGHYFLGLLDEADRRPEEALRQYDTALAAQADAVEPLEAMSHLLAREHRVPEALRRLDEAAKRAPQSSMPLNLRGELLAAEKRYPEAQSAAQEAIARTPAWWVPYRTVAFIALARGDRPAAVAVLKDGLAKVAEPNRLRAQLAEVYAASGQREAAISAYEEILRTEPRELLAANNLAMLLVGTGADAGSIGHAAEVVKPLGDSPNSDFLDTYGWVKLKQGDLKAALAALEKAEAARPDSKEFRYHLGMAQLAAGLKDKATDNLKLSVASGAQFSGVDEAKATLAKLASGQ